ncbi:MAG: DNA topoisomerase IV subunit A [Pseudomonadota bacterium]|nr:DNA topoisomerase IV subunit A [Pseudomonadota bacterium]
MKTPQALDILEKPLAEVLGERYLSYALSTIMARSLPDVRDGLKPVHRRLLYAMSQLKLEPNTPPKKSARVVGDVIGRFHPHGDVAVYEAMVRLAQDFSVRYPLVNGQGNFGNIDGDNAAAMRYTEARLTLVAKALLEGIDENAVDFRPTYDGSEQEPMVLPAAFPNLLANGATGIAVGMATSIPPHNVGELCDALSLLIEEPETPIEKLAKIIPGPDFPTGGILVESRDAVTESYRTGRGSFRLRARWGQESLAQGTWQIVVTEIPYMVQKSRLIEKIAELLAEKKLPLLDDVRDESAEDIRLILVPKSRNVDADMLMESLFRATDLETRFPLNMNVLDADSVPRVMNLREVLQAFLNHRRQVLVRCSRYRVGKIEQRLEILGGYLIAYLNLDAVIKIIRNEDEPRPVLMARFKLTENQAEAILNMRLRALRKLEEIEIKHEHDELNKERDDLNALLKSDRRQWTYLSKEIAHIKKQFGEATPLGKRRTKIGKPPDNVEITVDAVIEREPVTVFLSDKGWIRTVGGHLTDTSDVKYKEGDSESFVLHAETTDKLLLFSSQGKFYTLGVDKLPRGRGFGEPVRLMIDLPNEADVVTLMKHTPGGMLLVAASDGRGFRVAENDVLAQTKAGKQILTAGDGAVALVCVPAQGDTVAVIGNNRKLLLFPVDEVPPMAKGRGVILQKYKDGSLSDAKVFTMAEGLTWQLGERTRTVPAAELTPWMAVRAGTGRLPPNGFPTSNKFGG